VAGYSPDVSISPDGQFISSGSSSGEVFFWDWKTCKVWHKIQASDAPVLAVQWHPRETSKVITGDLNGVLKYWD
jgi:pre-mRNA-processing factor 17